MAKRPIYRAKLHFNYSERNRLKKNYIITFVTTDDLEEINKNELIKSRICNKIKKKKDKININIFQVDLMEQFGETTDRF